MRNRLLFFLLLVLPWILVGCDERCTTCHLVQFGYTTADSSVTDHDFCGKSREVADFKQELDDAAFHHKKIARTCCYTLTCLDQ